MDNSEKLNNFSTERYLAIVRNKLNYYIASKENVIFLKFASDFIDDLDNYNHFIVNNDVLFEWSELLEDFFGNIEALSYERFLANCISYIYISSKELMAIGNPRKLGEKFSIEYFNFIEKLKSSEDLYSKVMEINKYYDDFLKYKLLEQRVKFVNFKELDEKFEEHFSEGKNKIDRMRKDIEDADGKLSAIKKDLGFTSLFSGFDSYSQQVKGKLRWASLEVICLKITLLILPVLAGLYAYSGGVEYSLYGSLFVLGLGVGALLKMAARKQDQFEQVLSQINLKTSIAVFHEAQLEKIGDGERKYANEKFLEFVYSDIKTSEWSYPDLTSNLVEVIKAAKGKS